MIMTMTAIPTTRHNHTPKDRAVPLIDRRRRQVAATATTRTPYMAVTTIIWPCGMQLWPSSSSTNSHTSKAVRNRRPEMRTLVRQEWLEPAVSPGPSSLLCRLTLEQAIEQALQTLLSSAKSFVYHVCGKTTSYSSSPSPSPSSCCH